MKLIYLFLFIIILSCSSVKKEYVCGDHLCKDKKEFNEYFSKNLIIEIKSQEKKKKNKDINLVKLNTDSIKEEKNDNTNSKNEELLMKKNKEEQLKIEKNKLLEERKIQEKEEKDKRDLSKIIKLKEKNEISNNREQINKIPNEKKPIKKSNDNNISINSVKTENLKGVCDEIADCDIDKITELLIKKGQNKPFPNILSK